MLGIFRPNKVNFIIEEFILNPKGNFLIMKNQLFYLDNNQMLRDFVKEFIEIY